MNCYVFIASALLVVGCQVFGQDQFYGFNESACVQTSGMCIQSSECESFVPGDSLCAAQKALGFECCYGLPKSEHRCRMRGGECFKNIPCAPEQLYREASDCIADEHCCILV
ncbi:uncharacterized protein CBL_00013 [Carabus blaptoides fortunei]